MQKTDMHNQKRGHLLITGGAPSKQGRAQWLCLCSCGRTCTRSGKQLRNSTENTTCGVCRVYMQDSDFSSKIKQGMIGKTRFVDLMGHRFGRLKVVEKLSNTAPYSWRCECDCGQFSECLGSNLSIGKIKSCGCTQGVRNNGRVPAHKYIWFNYRGSAKRKKRKFDISLDVFAALISRPCDYCGKPPSQGMSPSQLRHESYASFLYNGLDRIDSSKGYTEDNVVPCCKACNELKSDKTREEFLSAIEAIHRWQHR